MKPGGIQFIPVVYCLALALLAIGLLEIRALANSISFSPAEGNAGTAMNVIVTGFEGTNGPVPVSIGGASIADSCGTTRPCIRAANMGNFSGTFWVAASAVVDGVNVVVSNSFTVRTAKAFISRGCGPGGTKVIVTGQDFARNSIVAVANSLTQADAAGRFAVSLTLPSGPPGLYDIITHDGTRFVTNQFYIDANSACEEDIGHVANLEGEGTVQHPGGQPQPLHPGDPIRLGDIITIGAGGRANLLFLDDSTITMNSNAKLLMDTQVYDPANHQNDKSWFSFMDGAFAYVSGLVTKRPDNNVRLNTPVGNIGIRGTEFISRRDPCSATQEVYLIHGQLAIMPTNSTVTNIVNAPATIYFDATNVWTNSLTQATYDALKAEFNQTNPVTFASWLVQNFGCTNDNPSATATADPDGDGQNNYAEFLARTDPTTNASVFKLISAARESDGVRLFWQTHGGITNVVQAAASIGGDYTNISPNIVIPGDADVTTNYLDAGVITNAAARFYRVRLVQ
jgi:hypothetical protein